MIPIGRGVQELQVHERRSDGVTARNVLAVRFVPMTGIAQRG